MCISAGNRQHEGFWVVLYRSAACDIGSDETKHARIRQILFAMSVSAPKRRLRSESLGLQNLKQISQRSVVGVCSLIGRSSGALSYSFSANLAKLKTIFWESGFFGASASTIGVLIRIAQSGLSLGQTKMASIIRERTSARLRRFLHGWLNRVRICIRRSSASIEKKRKHKKR